MLYAPHQHTSPGLSRLVRAVHDHSLQPTQLLHQRTVTSRNRENRGSVDMLRIKEQ